MKLRYGPSVLSPIPEWETIRESHRNRVKVAFTTVYFFSSCLFFINIKAL